MISLLSTHDVVFFDLDGTLYDTRGMALYSFRRAGEDLADKYRLDLPTWTDTQILGTVGHPGHEQGAMLLPQDLHHLAEELHRGVQAYERRFIKEGRAVLFEGVEDLLQQLRQQEFRIYLASNCSIGYRDVVLGHFGLFRYFEHAFCIGEFPGKRKTDMVHQAVARVGGTGGFMVGDRSADIEAGRNNGLTTVACRYGFGTPSELAAADFAVDSVAGLRHLLSRRHLVLRDTVSLLQRQWRQSGDPNLLVGVSGRDNSGKTTFATELAHFLHDQGIAAVVVHVDDFHRPRAQRQSPNLSPPQAYYRLTFAWERLLEEVIRPVREGTRVLSWHVFDRHRDELVGEINHPVQGPTVIIVEGVFLYRPDFAGEFDYRILLDCDPNEALQRAVERDSDEFGSPEEVRRRYLARYVPGQELYEDVARPHERAHLIIDNTVVDFPRIRGRG